MSSAQPPVELPPGEQPGPGEESTPDAVADKAAAMLRENAEADAAAAPRRPGRPRGSRDTRQRKRSRPAARVEAAPEPPAPPAEPTEAEIVGLAAMLSMGWRLLGARLRRRPLTDSESRMLASAAHPVLAKYGAGMLDQWGAEIALAVTVLGLWDLTKLPPEVVVINSDPFHEGESLEGASAS